MDMEKGGEKKVAERERDIPSGEVEGGSSSQGWPSRDCLQGRRGGAACCLKNRGVWEKN